MKWTAAGLFLIVISFLQPAYAGDAGKGEYSLTGAVVTAEGTMVPRFTVVLRPETNKPQLIRRFHFEDGLFALKKIKRGHYKVHITSPGHAGVVLDLNAQDSQSDFYRTVVLQPARLEADSFLPLEFSLKRVTPEGAEQAYARGVQLHRDGRLDEAMMAYGEAIRLYPEYVDALADIGALYILLDRPSSAMTFLRRAQRVDPGNVVVRMNMAASYVNQRNFGAGIDLYNELLSEYRENNLIRYQLAQAYWSEGRLDLAEKIVREALNLDPESVAGWVLLLNLAADQGKEQVLADSLLRLRDRLSHPGFSDFVEMQMLSLAATSR